MLQQLLSVSYVMMDELPKKNYLKVVPNAWPAK
jgi:hypothetical protein